MIGILFLFFIGLWIVLCVYLARKIPKWLGIERYTLSTSVAIFSATACGTRSARHCGHVAV
jgi:hypothetical protein